MRVLFVDHSTRLKSIRDLETRARGGMISSLIEVTNYLAAAGHTVEVWTDIEEEWSTTDAGAWWVSEPQEGYDVIVFNRGMANGLPAIEATARVLWTHDLPHAGFIPEPRHAKALDCTVFMSRFGEQIWRDSYRDIGRGVIIPHGVDKALFRPREKDLGLAVYASAPNRGLRRVPLISDAIAARIDKPFETIAFSDWNMHPGEVHEDEPDDMPYEHSETFTLSPTVPQGKLASTLGRAGLLFLPSGYPEICSNTVLQALACGTPVVTTGPSMASATTEWIKDGKNGVLTRWTPAQYMIYTVEIVRRTVEVLSQEVRHRQMCERAAATTVMSWQQVGQMWEKLLTGLAAKRRRFGSTWGVGMTRSWARTG